MKMLRSLKFIHWFLFFIFFLAFFLRVYRVDQILGFYFDQGRDANVIWELVHNQNFFLIGPTTGIAGIFRGPWYYWLITPFYFFGGGDPVWPAIFLSFTTVVAICFLYKLGKKIEDYETAILATILASFSSVFVYSARWLSNPTPMYLISMLTIYSLFMTTKGKQIWWIMTAFLWAMAMQFGSAAEIFYFPCILIFALLNKKTFPSFKTTILCALAFLIVFGPQIIFDFRNNHLLLQNIKNFVFSDQTFNLSILQVAQIRLEFYYDVLVNKFFPLRKDVANVFLVISAFSLLVNFKNLWKNHLFKILILFTFIPFLGMIFFQGNEGNVYDYYFTGYYFVYVLFFSVLLVALFKKSSARAILVSIFLLIFFSQNIPVIFFHLKMNTNSPESINFESQKKAIQWIYADAKDQDFNVDVYVPPVIPHAYDYLLKWYPTTPGFYKTNGKQTQSNVPLLYTLYESDSSHPERIGAWMDRQIGIGKVEYENQFGGIGVQRRKRINK